MKQQNFLFVELVSSIFLLIILIGNFMGLLYISDGNLAVSLLGSLFLVICYFFVIQMLKKNKEAMYKNKFMHSSILFWVFFLMLGFVSFTLMSHFINIEYNCKDQIKDEATQKIKLVDSLSAVYQKRAKADMLNFEAQLKTTLTQYQSTKSNFLKDSLTKDPYMVDATVLSNPNFIDVSQVAVAKLTPIQLKITSNIKNIDSTIKLNSRKYQAVFDNWKRLSLMASYSKLNQYVEDNIRMLNLKISELPLDKTPVNVTYNEGQIPLNNPSKLNKLYPPKQLLPLFIIAIIHLFILIPFLLHQVRGYKSSSSPKKSKQSKSTTGTIEI